MANYQYRRRRWRQTKKKQSPLGLPELLVLVAVVLTLVATSFLSISGQQLTRIAWILAGMAAGLAGIVLVVAAVYYRRQARKWRLFKLADIDQMGGIEFEHYLVKLLRALKYQQVSVTQGQGDFGVDILYQKDGLKYAAQVKRKRGLVGVDALYQAVGGRDFYHADVAVVITNSQFSPAAYKFARQSKVELVDRSKLAEWVVAAQQLG